MQIMKESHQAIHYVLRIASAMCFIGHGTFGLITKPIWCNYFGVFGISQTLSYRMMPIVGGFDILLGLTLLVYPLRLIPAWLVLWGFVTALLRPLSGEPLPEFFERAGNFGAPLALILTGGGIDSFRSLFRPIKPNLQLSYPRRAQVQLCLQWIVFFLLAGHGWLNLLGKQGLLEQYSSLGFEQPEKAAFIAGMVEVIGAFTLLVRPLRPWLLFFLIWKISSEFFYPRYELAEWIERGGSYGAILSLLLLMGTGNVRHTHSDSLQPTN